MPAQRGGCAAHQRILHFVRTGLILQPRADRVTFLPCQGVRDRSVRGRFGNPEAAQLGALPAFDRIHQDFWIGQHDR